MVMFNSYVKLPEGNPMVMFKTPRKTVHLPMPHTWRAKAPRPTASSSITVALPDVCSAPLPASDWAGATCATPPEVAAKQVSWSCAASWLAGTFQQRKISISDELQMMLHCYGYLIQAITLLSCYYTLWLFNIAMENGPFIDGVPFKNGDFPWLC